MKESYANKAAKGASILIAANFIVKLIGVVYKIPLSNILGSEGMNYLTSAYEIYQLILSIFASGGALAVSRMIAESSARGDHAGMRRTFRVVLATSVCLGAAGTAAMFFGGQALAVLIENPGASYSIMALSPAVFFLCITAVMRGYYQGLQDMVPTAVSQVVEAAIKLLAGVLLALSLLKAGQSLDIIAAGGILGTSVSTLFGFLFIFLFFNLGKRRRERKKLFSSRMPVKPAGAVLSEYLKLAWPLAIGSLTVNLTGVLDLVLIFDRLKSIGQEAGIAYRGYKGYAQTLFNLAPSIIASINISVIPAMTAARAVGDMARLKSIALRSAKVVNILAIPCAVGLLVLAEPIQRLLFPARLDEIAVTTPLLQILSIASFWVCVSSLSTAMLQSLGFMKLPVLSLAIGGAVKLIVNYILIGIPSVGIFGAPIGTTACYVVIFFLNNRFLKKHGMLSVPFFKTFLKPMAAAAAMAAFAVLCFKGLCLAVPEMLATAVSVAFAVPVYALVLLAVNGLTEQDVTMLPMGGKIAALLKRMKLLKPQPKN